MSSPYAPLISTDIRLGDLRSVFFGLSEHFRKRKDAGFYMYPLLGIPFRELDETCDRNGTTRAMPFDRYKRIHDQLVTRAQKVADRANRRLAEIAQINRKRFEAMSKEAAQVYIIRLPRHEAYRWYEWALPHGLTREIVSAKTSFWWCELYDPHCLSGPIRKMGGIPGTWENAIARPTVDMAA